MITAVSPETEIHANDLLTFVGKVDDVRELWSIFLSFSLIIINTF